MNTCVADIITNMDNRIKKVLDERGYRPATFAKKIGVPSSTIYSITRGNTKFENIGIETFMKIADGLDLTVEELWYGDDYPASRIDTIKQHIDNVYETLNEDGRRKVAAYMDDLAMSGRYDLKSTGNVQENEN